MLVEICDLCWMEGLRKFAVAKYIDMEGKEWAICSKCLGIVKQTPEMEWWPIPDTEE